MKVLGKKREKKCRLCRKRPVAKDALICLYCFNHRIKMKKG